MLVLLHFLPLLLLCVHVFSTDVLRWLVVLELWLVVLVVLLLLVHELLLHLELLYLVRWLLVGLV